ncbi:magnesium/cobalt transporter CorA [Legionella sp. MW5194]|uniref:magnesium/cobalt transporter CorA n=1 Tax=Legionella sp. MW5194 TaxID=2662448 RepID=UPI00193E6C3C|nr:magnesium/cobalt transporter CorA [Legionella sp. MW5194]QRN02486.1 magnesium/cobalt transporter CorA [Legionella sp. MW5194]
MAKYRRKASAKSGMLPGSAVYVGDKEPQATHVSIHVFDADAYHRYDHFNAVKIHEALAAHQNVWVDVQGLSDSSRIADWCTEFHVHPLVIEDILNTHQRPKLDILDDSLFIVLQLLDTSGDEVTYQREQFSMLLRKNLLLTFRESSRFNLASLDERLSNPHSLVCQHRMEYLAYLLMDTIVDDYFNFVEETEKKLGEIEDIIIINPSAISLRELYTIKRRTLTLRKIIAPMRDIVHLLLTEHARLIDPHYYLYYRDLHDHSIRLVELIDLHREMSTGMLEIYLSAVNNHMNETMKILTLFASLFIPLSFIAGVYGMNFEFMPELKWRYGYPAILTLMILLAMLMFYFFKRKKLL